MKVLEAVERQVVIPAIKGSTQPPPSAPPTGGAPYSRALLPALAALTPACFIRARCVVLKSSWPRCSPDCCCSAVSWCPRLRCIARCTPIAARTRIPACSASSATESSINPHPLKSGSTGSLPWSPRRGSLIARLPQCVPTDSRRAAHHPHRCVRPKVEGRRGQRTPTRTSSFQSSSDRGPA